MQKLSDRHRRWVANSFSGKVKELHHHLSVMVAACDQSIRLFSARRHVPEENHRVVTFGFSAFVNVIQTLKDAMQTVTRQQLPWSKIEALRHGNFMRGARNATTHDGHAVVDAWADGHYFVPAKIVRIDNQGQTIEIDAPDEDIRTVCLEFAEDFCRLLRETLAKVDDVKDLIGTRFSITELDEAFANSKVVPEFAAHLFSSNRSEIATGLDATRHDPVAKATDSLDEVIRYCELMLNS